MDKQYLTTLKVKLKTPPEIEENILQLAGSSRFVFNWALDLNNKENNIKDKACIEKTIQALSCFDLYSRFNILKKENDWLNDIEDLLVKQIFKDLEDSIVLTKKLPSFKTKKNIQLIKYHPDQQIHIIDNSIKLPNIGIVKTWEKLENNLEIRQVSLIQDNLRDWYAHIIVKKEIKKLPKTDKIIGLHTSDHNILTSDGDYFSNKNKLSKLEKKLKREKRSYKRKLKRIHILNENEIIVDSNNAKKQKIRINRLQTRISNKIKDFNDKTSMSLVSENQAIGLKEDTTDINMNKIKLSENSQLFQFIEYKAEWYERHTIIFENKNNLDFQPENICSKCGNDILHIPESVNKWTCSKCGTVHDKELNSSINLKKVLKYKLRTNILLNKDQYTNLIGTVYQKKLNGEPIGKKVIKIKEEYVKKELPPWLGKSTILPPLEKTVPPTLNQKLKWSTLNIMSRKDTALAVPSKNTVNKLTKNIKSNTVGTTEINASEENLSHNSCNSQIKKKLQKEHCPF